MNHHAEKVRWTTDEPIDPTLGGTVDELYACPACGTGASRSATGAR